MGKILGMVLGLVLAAIPILPRIGESAGYNHNETLVRTDARR